jgi:alcohol dehydrogenase class IV
LAVLARHAGVGVDGEPEDLLAHRFLDSVDALNVTLGIPRHLDALRVKDIPALARAACWEADANYPVPRRMTQADCEALLREVLAPARARKRTPRAPAARTKAKARA